MLTRSTLLRSGGVAATMLPNIAGERTWPKPRSLWRLPALLFACFPRAFLACVCLVLRVAILFALCHTLARNTNALTHWFICSDCHIFYSQVIAVLFHKNNNSCTFGGGECELVWWMDGCRKLSGYNNGDSDSEGDSERHLKAATKTHDGRDEDHFKANSWTLIRHFLWWGSESKGRASLEGMFENS